jgi:two-component system cell cycle sensor histidine kinase/response regulator CckA
VDLVAANLDQQLFHRVPTGLYIGTMDGRLLEANPGLLRLLGYESRDKLAGIGCWDFYADHDDREALVSLLQTRGVIENREAALMRRDGGRVPALASLAMFESGGEKLVFGALTELTAQKELQSALRESEHRYRAIVENGNDAILAINRDSTIVFANAAANALFGYEDSGLVGRKATDLMPEQFRQLHRAGLERYLYGGERHFNWSGVELPGVRRDGTPLTLEISLSEVGEGEARIFSAVLRDVSQRKEMEEELRNGQKMQAIGRLAGGVAHEFNNLLTIILTSTSLLAETCDPESQQLVGEIQSAADRAATLTRQLLAFGRRQRMEPELLDLNEVIAEATAMLGPIVGKNIELRFMPADSLPRIRADHAQLEEVLMNLALHARDSMPEGGRVLIQTRRLTLTAARDIRRGAPGPGQYVLLSVSDSSRSSSEVRSRLFEPFYSTQELGRGQGLGLASVYGIVKQSGGSIWAEAEAEKGGTVIHIYFPVPEAELLGEGFAEGGAGREHPIVLVADDEPAVRWLMRSVLQLNGYPVLEAAGAEEALAHAEQHRGEIGLLISDVVMPEMSGSQLAQRLRSENPKLKVILTSGYGDSSIVRETIAGADFLQKPFSPERLVAAVQSALKDGHGS